MGWCAVRPINYISNRIATSCNHVVVRDTASSKLVLHHFAMWKLVKDVSLQGMFQAMYQHDFNEPELVGTNCMLKYGDVSYIDKFMENVDRGTYKKDDIISFHFHFMIQISCC